VAKNYFIRREGNKLLMRKSPGIKRVLETVWPNPEERYRGRDLSLRTIDTRRLFELKDNQAGPYRSHYYSVHLPTMQVTRHKDRNPLSEPGNQFIDLDEDTVVVERQKFAGRDSGMCIHTHRKNLDDYFL